MIIVPDDATVVGEVNIMNKYIKFIPESQPMRIKREGFNFTDYRIIPGVVKALAAMPST